MIICIYNPISCLWAESNDVVRSTTAGKCAVFIIISVAISLRALVLKDLRVVCGWTFSWCFIRRSAAVLRLIKLCTRTLACNYAPIGPLHLQLSWASSIDVGGAGRGLAVARAALWGNRHGQVEAINKTYVVEILASVWDNIYFD